MSTVSMHVDVGGSDKIPHTFLMVTHPPTHPPTHPDGRVDEYGFAPQVTRLSGIGKIDITGPGTEYGPHEFDFQTQPQQLSDAQYQRLMEKINHSIANTPYYIVSGRWTPGDGTNCTGWAIGVWHDTGLPNTFGVTNTWVWNPYGQAMNLAIAGLVNTDFLAAKSWTPPRDLLVLDLDGDGIETAGIDPTAPVLFDMDGDGVKTATGWIRPDDGIVVLDRNGNGLIDSGRELFGDATVLARGARAGQLAANGFEALADLDLNADGRLDSLDASWGQLRIWRDLNQDGVSQAGELTTLAAQGIASLGAQGTQSNVNLGGGNTQVMSGSFTRTNGMLGTSGVAEVAGSLLLASNNSYREFSDEVAQTLQWRAAVNNKLPSQVATKSIAAYVYGVCARGRFTNKTKAWRPHSLKQIHANAEQLIAAATRV